MDEADLYSDEIAIINGGKIAKSGTSSQLKHSLRSEILQFHSKHVGSNHDGIDENILRKVKDLAFVSDAILCDSRLDVFVEDADSALPLVIEALRCEDVAIERISTARPTLDDVFLKYAGALPFRRGGK